MAPCINSDLIHPPTIRYVTLGVSHALAFSCDRVARACIHPRIGREPDRSLS